MFDIVDVKNLCKRNIWNAYVKNGVIYLRNETGEVVKIGVVDTNNASNYCKTELISETKNK